MIIVHKPEKEWVRFDGTSALNVRKISSLVSDGIWTQADLDRYGLRVAEPEIVPEGKIATGEERIVEREGRLVVKRDVVDRPPPPPPPTDADRLERHTGLTVAQIKAVLGIGAASR